MKTTKQCLMVSVIIVVKNDLGIEATLSHLYKQTAKIPFEVIVIDSSKPSRLASIRRKFPEAVWDQFPVSNRRTTAEQRNRGLELAKGEIIAFIDANCIPADTWLSSLDTTIQGGKDIVCGPVLDTNESNLVHYAPTHTAGKYVDTCTTISVGLRREVVEKVGQFDTSFSFGQDVDFFWRASDAGYKIYFEPAFSIQHDWGDNSEQLNRAFEYGKARAHLFKKHWKNRKKELLWETHVWIYPLFILGLPLTYFVPFYPLLVIVPILKNIRQNPVGLIVHHLSYGLGVLAGTFKRWPHTTVK